MKTPAHRRTVEETIAQADAKDRIRRALRIRSAGVGLTVLGAAFLLRSRSWRPHTAGIRAQIHGGPSSMSLSTSIGIAGIVVGLFALAVGHWLVARAIKAAKNNPVTASVVRQSLR